MEVYEMFLKDDVMALQEGELVEYVNYMMDKGYSFNKLCEEKGLYNKTIRKRMKSIGAEYDKDSQRYVIAGVEMLSNQNDDVIETQKETRQEVKKNPKTQSKQLQNVLSLQDKDILIDLKEAILSLRDEVATINENNVTIKPERASIEVKETNGFSVLNLNGEVKSRPVKFYPDVLERLDSFCDNMPQYSKQRVINTLLMKAMDLYEE